MSSTTRRVAGPAGRNRKRERLQAPAEDLGECRRPLRHPQFPRRPVLLGDFPPQSRGSRPELPEHFRLGVTTRQTVVTGNVRAVAELKLDIFGLATHIDWNVGAYGEDADLRPALVDLALTRSAIAAADTVLVGDTPADIEGGHANGVRVIAVATGRSSAVELREAGADVVLDDLTDTDLLRRLVFDRS
ncbi:HAD family hydrolase [Streptomyces montanisoli]|uniref:HAD family hydrolase n=1 Tax=Streptomyces montanisoli TaxID=2798581 RepID=UPI0027DC8B84|nr:HAD hydrolase-like protein [Streptomyces montanisoli]